MKKYWVTASLFLFNAEILSWLALLILAIMAVHDFGKAAETERRTKWKE